MKTAKEWAATLGKIHTDGHDCGSFRASGHTYLVISLDQIKQIQLDAYRQGMTDAASLVSEGGHRMVNAFIARDAILTARDNKTTI